MSQHTPGPWIAQQDLRSYKNNGIITNGPYAWGIYATTRIACLEEIFSDDEQAANARLIAAAPKLLVALELAEETLRHMVRSGDSIAPRHVRDVIQEALAEAKGA